MSGDNDDETSESDLVLTTEREARAQARVGQTVRGDSHGDAESAAPDHRKRDADVATPHAVRASREDGVPDQLAPHVAEAEDRQEALVDEGVEETFPASDPVSAKRIT